MPSGDENQARLLENLLKWSLPRSTSGLRKPAALDVAATVLHRPQSLRDAGVESGLGPGKVLRGGGYGQWVITHGTGVPAGHQERLYAP